MRLSHTQKVRLARRMRTRKEISEGVSIWDSKAWLKRREVNTGIKGGRTRPLPAYIRNAVRTLDIKAEGQKESLLTKARNFVGKKMMRQKVV